jgi:hypothetical protein
MAKASIQRLASDPIRPNERFLDVLRRRLSQCRPPREALDGVGGNPANGNVYPRDDAHLSPRTHERVAHMKRRGPDHDDQIIEGMEDNADGPAEPFTSALFITLSCSVQHAGDGSDIDDPSSIWPD